MEPDGPSITIMHSLPGRTRLRMSIIPPDTERILSALREHPGFVSAAFSPRSRSLLVRYQPTEFRQEEVLLRAAVALSLSCGAVPVRVLSEPQRHDVSPVAAFSGASLAIAALLHWGVLHSEWARRFEWAGGAGTVWAVLDHGWKEIRERGYFDPEVLTLAYLLTSAVRGNVLGGAVVTWILAFGRHLLQIPKPGVEVQPLRLGGPENSPMAYEVVVRPDPVDPEQQKLLTMLRAIFRYAISGTDGRGNLISDIRDMSRLHGETLEGLRDMPKGIIMRFEGSE